MGNLVYENTVISDVDDRLLAHLQIVIGAKLRRQESFFLTLETPVRQGSGRRILWIHPRAGLLFEFSGSRESVLNRVWIEEMMQLANSGKGLAPIPEPRD